MTKRNLTVQLDEDVIQQAKVLAARRGTTFRIVTSASGAVPEIVSFPA